MMRQEPKGALQRFASTAIVVFVGAAAIAVLLGLADQNRRLKELVEAGSRPPRPEMVQGDILPPVGLVDLAGQTTQLLDFVEGGGVIAFFTTTCRYCIETLPLWEDLGRELEAAGVPFLTVSLHDLQVTKNFVAERSPELPMQVLPNLADARLMRITGVPLTVLVSADGEVVNLWKGALSSADANTIASEAKILCPSGC